MSFECNLLEEFKQRCPDLADDIMSYKYTGELELTVELYSRIAIYFVLWNRVIVYDNDDLTDDGTILEIFANKVKYRLFVKSLTQEDLSRKTGITRVMINRYLNRKASPSWLNACKIADALNCSTEEFRIDF